MNAPDDAPLDVVVVGSGVAGLEAVMALRALAGHRVRIQLLSPEPEFVYRPLAVGEPFDLGAPQRHDVEAIASNFDTEVVRDSLDWVATRPQSVFTTGGRELSYDALVLTMGARPEPAWEHTITFTGPREADAMRGVVGEVERGEVGSVAFVVPDGATWPLPLYELAMLTARRAQAAGVEADVALYTPENDPLSIFGREASRRVADELAAAGVQVARSARVEVTQHGDLVLPHEEWSRRYERVIALPRLRGMAPRGIPHDGSGFIPIDAHGLVIGVDHVYAAGDGTDYPIKHGGIATQQADALAEVIAKRAGAGVDPRPFSELLRGRLITGADPHFIQADLGSRATDHSEASTSPLWWPASKIAGVHLGPYLASLDTSAPAPEPERRIVFLPGFENNPWGE